MSTFESSLPERWVQRIFATMRATYGAAFDRQWQCPAGTEPADHVAAMLAHWGRELRGYQQNPGAITYALENLPEHPPNLIEFRALLRRRPDVAQPLLEAPKVPPERIREAMASIVKPPAKDDPRQWARDLEQREKRGENLTIAQRLAWREAMATDTSSDAELFGACQPIPDECLPPAMRKHAIPASMTFDEQDDAAANAEAQALQWEQQP